MPLSFEVKPTVLETPAGALMGFCDLILDGKIVFKGFKIFKSKKNDSLFVSNPSQLSKKVGEDGKPVYFDQVQFIDMKEKEDDWRTPFQEEVYAAMLEEFEKALNGGGTSKPKTQSAEGTQAPAGPPRAKRPTNPIWGNKQ